MKSFLALLPVAALACLAVLSSSQAAPLRGTDAFPSSVSLQRRGVKETMTDIGEKTRNAAHRARVGIKHIPENLNDGFHRLLGALHRTKLGVQNAAYDAKTEAIKLPWTADIKAAEARLAANRANYDTARIRHSARYPIRNANSLHNGVANTFHRGRHLAKSSAQYAWNAAKYNALINYYKLRRLTPYRDVMGNIKKH